MTGVDAKVIELGGGDTPRFHPNVDVRSGPHVDIVFDFDTLDGTKHIPVEDGSYDIVYSRFAIEHISWRHTKNFVSEISRILKRDGAAVVIAPNTFQQCRNIVARGHWVENDSCMLFGDQNYGENSHKAGWSPAYLRDMFYSAGFERVHVEPLPQCETDLILVAERGITTVRLDTI